MIAQRGTLEISRSRALHNIRLFRERIPTRTKLCAVMKADAYGHGVVNMMEILAAANIDWCCVYSLEQALELSVASPRSVLVLAPLVLSSDGPLPDDLLVALKQNIRFNLTDVASAMRLSAALAQAKFGEMACVHVQVDSGLTRAGADAAAAIQLLDCITKLPHLQLEGVFTHFSHGEIPDHPSLRVQLSVLNEIATPFKKRFPDLLVHAQNSGAAWNLHNALLDLARIGIALYGLQPSMATPIPDLLPIARLTAPILAIHERPAGTGVGYGHTFITRRPSRLAVVPVGYADGYPRQLSNNAVAQVRDTDVPVVGRVSMDQIVLDITDFPEAGVGEEVTVISWDPQKPNSLDQMASKLGTIGYELATHFGARLRRILID